MIVKEVIKFECWIDEMRIWQYTFSENIIEIAEEELPKTANEYDWDWYVLPENPYHLIRDVKIIVEFYTLLFMGDDEPIWNKPIVKFSKWESEIYNERIQQKGGLK